MFQKGVRVVDRVSAHRGVKFYREDDVGCVDYEEGVEVPMKTTGDGASYIAALRRRTCYA